jgi:hypothetical protein
MDDVVKSTVYLTDLTDLAVFRGVRDRYIDVAEPPASTLMQVGGLVNPEFRGDRRHRQSSDERPTRAELGNPSPGILHPLTGI